MKRGLDFFERMIEIGYTLDKDVVVTPKGKRLSGSIAKNGYRYVSIHLEPGKGVMTPVHRIVAFQKYSEAMFADGIEVRHRDGVRLNNNPGNILLGSRLENIMDMTPAQRSSRCFGKPSPRRLLSDKEVSEIKATYANGVRRGDCKKLALKFGVGTSTISEIGRGKSYVS